MADSVRVLPADPQGVEALALLREAAVEARQMYPELFAADAPWPTNPPVGERGAFVLAYVGDALAGSGALRMIDETTAEVRRMFVRASARRAGVAALGYSVLRLETGVRQQPAMALYEAAGFKRIAPFGEYVGDPTSVCFEKQIAGIGGD
jgi:putative acetyltransferase